jgi:hypothetical protein
MFNHHSTYDPIVGYTKDFCTIPGIQLWPQQRKWCEADMRILVLGGSTTMWPTENLASINHLLGEWAKFLGELIEAQGHKPLIFNAAACGYSSDQELLHLLRDGPGLQPNLVISMSGVNDINFMHSAYPYPLTHQYQINISKAIASGSDNIEYSFGVPWKCKDYERWIRNIRLCRLIALELGATYLACLQPVLGFGASMPTTTEEQYFLEKAKNHAIDGTKSYIESIDQFYNNIIDIIHAKPEYQKYVLDLTNIFLDAESVWADHRHPSKLGNHIEAGFIFSRLLDLHLI